MLRAKAVSEHVLKNTFLKNDSGTSNQVGKSFLIQIEGLRTEDVVHYTVCEAH